MKPGPRATSTIKGSKKGVAQGLLRGLSLFEGSVPSEQIKVCNWVPPVIASKLNPYMTRHPGKRPYISGYYAMSGTSLKNSKIQKFNNSKEKY